MMFLPILAWFFIWCGLDIEFDLSKAISNKFGWFWYVNFWYFWNEIFDIRYEVGGWYEWGWNLWGWWMGNWWVMDLNFGSGVWVEQTIENFNYHRIFIMEIHPGYINFLSCVFVIDATCKVFIYNMYLYDICIWYLYVSATRTKNIKS